MATLLRPGARVLDAGCGSDMPFTREISPKVATAAGIDYGVLQRVGAGTVGVQGDLGRLPFRDAAFHAIVSRSVLEHLKDPARVFAELFRVLKPGGTVVLLTPNKYDYVSLVSMATPFRFHQWLVSRTQDRREEDAFPTYYRANSKGRIRSLLEGSGFRSVKVELFNQYPAYLMFSPTLFRLGVLYERVTSRYRSANCPGNPLDHPS